jgi:tagatose 6-phosphate kinase
VVKTTRVAFVNANPSVGLIYRMREFTLGAVNRSSPPLQWPNGKSINAAIAFKRLGGDPVAVFPSGGALGEYLEWSLGSDLIRTKTLRISKEIRRTYLFFSNMGGACIETQVLEPGPNLSLDEQREFFMIVREVCQNEELCVISGYTPAGTHPDFYERLIHEIKSSTGCKVVLDTSGEALTHAVTSGPDILKINDIELAEILDVEIGDSVQRTLEEMERLGSRNKIANVIVTRGPNSVLAWSANHGAFEAIPPTVNVTNSVGAGDCFIAGWLSRINEGIEASLKMAVATASAKVMTMLPRDIDLGSLAELHERVKVTQLTM